MAPPRTARSIAPVLYHSLSADRLEDYLAEVPNRDASHAIALYLWNTEISGAFWEALAHLEVALRNALAGQLAARHGRRQRPGSWLDNVAKELDRRAERDIGKARARVQMNRKPPSDGQTISELPFGFWRYLLTKKYASTLWPDVANAFPYSPDRSLATVEQPVHSLHRFRNRVAHHHRIWTEPLSQRWADLQALLSYLDPVLCDWVIFNSRVPAVLKTCPITRPHP
ncbi:Abi family protein [Phytoactinopolyspora halotolerans]|uniref:Abi family protein n=1 Tax=Phytoactinopolyspora halotolerans TaxID=1981512 RepID=A0A6L9SH80_9ACTN|nr:Abi family protein [Phytoactinopolyspora halotolerans]NEE03450.1 hypothetical protein [Phytoactinopolyspora halotolerans]